MKYGPKVEWSQLFEGVRIYYTGDMANQSGFGVIEKRRISERFGYRQVDIKMDDGRTMPGIHDASFQPSPGRRFWLEADWQADRQKRIDRLAQAWPARGGRYERG